MKERIIILDKAKGIAIALVVLGHIGARTLPIGNDWYVLLKNSIYAFHMPLFMFLSGFVLFYSYKKVSSFVEYKEYVIKKFYRLIPGYLLFSLLVFFGKYISQYYMHVDNPVQGLTDLLKVFIQPMKSFSSFLWYIYVLFEYYLFIPLFFYITKGNYKYILSFSFIISAIGYFVSIPTYFALNQFCEYLFFVCLGGYVTTNYKEIFNYIIKYKLFFILLFICLLFARNYFLIPKMLLGFISIPAVISVLSFPIFSKAEFISSWGNNTFPIYLMNTIFIGLVKGIFLKFTYWDYYHFYFIAPVLFLAGLYLPIFVKKYVFKYIPILNKIIG